MNHFSLVALVSLGLSLSCSPAERSVRSEARAITIDGEFDDWEGLEPVALDSKGESQTEELDLGSLWIANDQEALYLRFETGRETIWQNEARQLAGNDLRIYLDTDINASTGTRFGVLGVDYEIHLGSRFALWHDADDTVTMSLNEVGLTVGPTHSSHEFEIRIPYHSLLGGSQAKGIMLHPRFKLSIMDASGGDLLPDKGALSCELDGERVPPPAPLSLLRRDPQDIRVLSHNIQYNGPIDQPEPFRRYLKALQPDVINFQEVWVWNAEETRNFVANTLKTASWHVAKVEDCVTVSRWPIRESAAVDGNLVCLINLPDERSSADLIVFNAHTPCCGHNEGRDYEHDHLAATLRDLLNGEGPFAVESGDGVLLTGDFNMVGFVRQLSSIRDGDIYDNGVFGSDFQPDRLAGSLIVAPLRHTHSRAVYSWRNDSEYYPPGRLDFILYGSSQLRIKNNFTLYTMDIPDDELEEHGLHKQDSLVSDHLVLVADFEPH